ncbi:hypothetical protein BJA5080_05247 [Bradyrhizobium diazoefficiens SEMIA 5080]|uniref:Uncharacterized protein n=1 Tax=Bradyrhizobium diazoefficiens SEMIA 5080 TaxID=754504 RepID=A0A837C373_9BRAD|nr:hypothetical protein BJA5080_05247 [Bradyrhizobium diazoefficiens SEMIA 5080]
MIEAFAKTRLKQMNGNPDRGPDRQRQDGEDGDYGGQSVHDTGRGRRGRNRPEVVETRDMAADVEQGENQFECEKPHGKRSGCRANCP